MQAKQYRCSLSARLDDDGCSRKYRIQQTPEGAIAKHRDKGPSSALKLHLPAFLLEMSAGRSAQSQQAASAPAHPLLAEKPCRFIFQQKLCPTELAL